MHRTVLFIPNTLHTHMLGNYSLLNEYSVLGPSFLVGIWSPSLRGDQSDQRTRSKTLYKFNNRIIIYLYIIINLIK